jgi:hypothetical protein
MDATSHQPWYVRHRMRALLLIIVSWLTFCAIVFSVVAWVFIGKVKQSEPYALALSHLQNDAQVRQLLGTPVEPGWLATGLIDDDDGYAELNMRVHGPKRGAGVRVIAEQLPGESDWTLVFLDMGVKDEAGGSIVTLIDDKPPTGPDLPEPAEGAAERYAE